MVALRLSGLRRRPGFTLIELIVVIALVLVMAAIALMFIPSFQDQDKAGLGARQLMGLLQMQKTLAMRDQRIRGVRLLPPPIPTIPAPTLPYTSLYEFSEIQSIEQPDEFSIGILQAVGTKKNSSIVAFINPTAASPPGVDFFGGFGPADPTLWPVQAGDYLQVNGGGLMWKITTVGPANANGTCNQLTLDMVNTMGMPQGAATQGPGAVIVSVQNAANIVNGMSLTIGTGNNEEVVQGVSLAGNVLTFPAAIQHTAPFAVRSNPPFPVASPVSIVGEAFPQAAKPPKATPLSPGPNQTIQPVAPPAVAQQMQGILAGSQLVLDAGKPNQEIVTVAQVGVSVPQPAPAPPVFVPYAIVLDYVQNTHGTAANPKFTVQSLDVAAATASPPITPPNVTYRIVRSPRVSSEEKLTLPTNIAIDLNYNKANLQGVPTPAADTVYNFYPPPAGGIPPVLAPLDILFSPSGSVVGPLAGYDKIILWVRDVSQPYAIDNEPVLVCIYTRSGAIVPHQVDPSGANGGASYYTFTRDGRPTEGQ